MAAEDVAAAVGRTAVGSPLNGKTEIGGPEEFRFGDLIQQHLALSNDPRKVAVDPHGTYFGTELEERSLVPGEGATLSETTYAEWLKSH